MQRRSVRTLLAALLAAGTLLPAAALTTAPSPHGALPAPPGTVSVTAGAAAPTSFAAGALTAARPHGATPPPVPAPQEAPVSLAMPDLLPDLLPDAGTAPALLLGLLAVAGALMRMVQRGNR